MANVGMYDHFSNPSDENKNNWLWKNFKETNFFSDKLQITEKIPEEKWVSSALLSTTHNSINSIAAPVVDYTNKISARVSNIIKPLYKATIWSPIETVKENWFWKWWSKMVWSTLVWTAWLLTDTIWSAVQSPAKVYERLINANVQDSTDILHLFSEKLRGMDKIWFKTVLPGFVDWLANWMKVLSKMGWYASWIYALNWLWKNLNLAADTTQEYVKLNNVELELARRVKNEDPTIIEA